MPQVDLESIVGSVCSGGGCSDRKITCETLAPAAVVDEEDKQNQQKLTAESDHQSSDFPPDSFWLSKDAELDWLDRNAFVSRQGSTRGSSFNSTNLIHGFHPNTANSSSHSQRFSNLKSKASILGLPKPQNSCFVDGKSRRHTKPVNTHLFPKRSGSAGKSSSSVAEPGSPKVSCMGRVRSKRDRNRRLRSRQRSKRSTEPELKKVKSVRRRETSSSSSSSSPSGFMASIRSIFKTCSKSKKQSKTESADSSSKSESVAKATRMDDIRDRLPSSDRDAPRNKSGGEESTTTAAAAGSFGGMMKFSSGRRSEDWANSVIDVA
ncbi:hypothetical protein LINPERHAP1_LOCUS12113 [Linum perenne]